MKKEMKFLEKIFRSNVDTYEDDFDYEVERNFTKASIPMSSPNKYITGVIEDSSDEFQKLYVVYDENNGDYIEVKFYNDILNTPGKWSENYKIALEILKSLTKEK